MTALIFPSKSNRARLVQYRRPDVVWPDLASGTTIKVLKRLRQNDYMDDGQNHPQDKRLFHGLLRFREIRVVCLQTAVFHESSEGAGKGAERQEADIYSHAWCREKLVA
jgi:hypothetical protein